MFGITKRGNDRDTLSLVVIRVERRLGFVLALLMLGIAGILASIGAGPIIQYASGEEVLVSAGMEGQACGSHLEWQMESREIAAGSRVTVLNDSVYWQIPVVIERQNSDGNWEPVAESPTLRGGESWNHTFWRGGAYRIISADETQRLAGLETAISVE
jgi:hypothetical protein